MKKLTRDIKKMLAALAMENAGEFIPMRDKINLLTPPSQKKTVAAENISIPDSAISDLQEFTPEAEIHVAILFDGKISDAVSDYVLNTAHIANARLDILAHGTDRALSQKAKQLSLKFQQAGRTTRTSLLSANPTHLFMNYRRGNPSLHLIVASDTDELVHDIINSAAYRDNNHHIPLVLIQNHREAPIPDFSIARGNFS